MRRHGVCGGILISVSLRASADRRLQEIIPFFQNLTLSKTTTNVEECYLELAELVRKGLGHIDPYFIKLADGMVDWIAGWRLLNPPAKQEA